MRIGERKNTHKEEIAATGYGKTANRYPFIPVSPRRLWKRVPDAQSAEAGESVSL